MDSVSNHIVGLASSVRRITAALAACGAIAHGGAAAANPWSSAFNMQDAIAAAIQQPFEDAASITPERWMRAVSDSVKLNRLTLPGTHDSAADEGCVAQYARFARTQDMTIPQQLKAGIRYLDMRIRPVAGGVLHLQHGRCHLNTTFDAELTHVIAFLKRNPTETVVMRAKMEWTDEGMKASYAPDLRRHVARNSAFFHQDGAKLTSMPTLGETRGKIVLLDQEGVGVGLEWKYVTQFQNFANPEVDDLWSTVENGFAKARNRPSDLILTAPTANGLTDVASAIAAFFGGKWDPSDYAEEINPRLVAYLLKDKAVIRETLGVVAMDFPSKGLINALITTNYPTRYTVQIDCYMQGVNHTGSDAAITVDFLAEGRTRIGSRTLQGASVGCDREDRVNLWSVYAGRPITGIRIKTDGENAFMIDQLALFSEARTGASGSRALNIAGGADNLKGWCLSREDESFLTSTCRRSRIWEIRH